MNFEDFIKKGHAKRASKDENLAKSLIEGVKNDLIFLEKLAITKESARKIMTNYYDVLRSLLEAISSLDGYKIYLHEAFTYYLKEKGENIISIKFDRFRIIRNKINYYGKDISIEETIENVNEIKKVINILMNKYINFNEK